MNELQKYLMHHYGIRFTNEAVLTQAFTHASFANERRDQPQMQHNERLEFLGDAVLELLVSDYLFHTFSHWTEGQLTRFRAQVVCEPMLSAFAKECGFDRFVRLGKGEETAGGRQRAALLCDLFEAFIGALYLDQGTEAVRTFITQVIFPKITSGNITTFVDYKTQLQEWLQRSGDINLAYVVVAEEGPPHARKFYVSAQLDGKEIGRGVGRSKKAAEQAAAQQALTAAKG